MGFLFLSSFKQGTWHVTVEVNELMRSQIMILHGLSLGQTRLKLPPAAPEFQLSDS